MRTLLIVLLIPFSISFCAGQFQTAGIALGLGSTIVDVAKAVEWDDLEEWDTWALPGIISTCPKNSSYPWNSGLNPSLAMQLPSPFLLEQA